VERRKRPVVAVSGKGVGKAWRFGEYLPGFLSPGFAICYSASVAANLSSATDTISIRNTLRVVPVDAETIATSNFICSLK
jgi:hypothetical protein